VICCNVYVIYTKLDASMLHDIYEIGQLVSSNIRDMESEEGKERKKMRQMRDRKRDKARAREREQ